MRYRLIPPLIILASVLMTRATTPCQQPEPTMMLYGFVFIRTVTGQNATALEGLEVCAKTNSTTISNTSIQEQGKYTLPVTALQEDELFDLYVQGTLVTTVQYRGWNVTWLNLTVVDQLAPVIEPLSPTPEVTLFQTPIWVNATIIDNVAVDDSSINVNLNESKVSGTYNRTTGLLSCQAEVANSGFYLLNITVSDLAGNATTKSWNFTFLVPIPPMVEIIYPTTDAPVHIRSNNEVAIAYNYTELYPRSASIALRNATGTVAKLDITPLEDTHANRNDTIVIDESVSDGKYTVSVTVFNIFNLSANAEQVEAIIVDNKPPKIEHVVQSPSSDSVQPSDTVKVNVTITDELSRVLNATLFWRAEEEQWNTVLMSKISGDIYGGTIPPLGNFTDVYYKIESCDEVGNMAVEDNAGLYHTYRVIPEYSAFPFAALLFALLFAFVILKRQALRALKTFGKTTVQKETSLDLRSIENTVASRA